MINKLHIKIGDEVKVITGELKGTIGKIISFNKRKSLAIIDSGKKRKKRSKITFENQQRDKLIPIGIHISNLMLWDKNLNQASRIGYKIIDSKKQRYFKKSGNII